MVHTFKISDDYFLYDVESGSLHLCDKLSFFIVQNINGAENDLSQFSSEDIKESNESIKKLIKEGLLFSKAPDYGFMKFPVIGEIKALCLHISHDCNLRCEYCFAGGGNYSGKASLMDFNTAKAAIDFLIKKSGGRNNLEIDFFGGEPLLNFDTVKKTVGYAKEQAKIYGKNFKFTLTTNALNLNDEIADFLNSEMDNVVLSIDGRKSTHDRVRKTINGKESFDVILKNAKSFKAKRGDKSYYIRGTFTSLNLDFSKDALFLNDCGFDQISIEPVVLNEDNKLSIKPCDLDLIKAEYESFAKEYIKRRKGGKWFNFFHFMIDLENGPCIKKRLTGCGAGVEYLAVAPDGGIYPCHQFMEKSAYKLGSVFENGLDAGIQTIFSESNLLTKQKCRDCFAKYNCSGGCAANSIFQAGDINKPYDISCEIMKKRTECSLYIYAMENIKKRRIK